MNIFRQYGNYSLFFIWGVIFVVSLFFSTTPLTLLFGLLFLLYLPGFSLVRLLRIPTNENRYDAWMLYLGVGFIANLLICWFAITFYANINILIAGYAILIVLFFILALILDLRRKALISANLTAKEVFRLENLIYLVPLALFLLVLLTVNMIGANFSGDPTYHISIIRKVVEGGRFGVAELSFLKNQPQVQYAYPVWLVWLGFLSKVFHLNIATIWDQVIVGLTAIAALAWGWIFQKIFNSKLISILSVSILFLASLANNAYLLGSFAVPDTICKLFVLPMSLALAFHFLAAKTRDWLILGLTVLMQFLAAIIHSTQYVYFFFMLGGFGLVYLILSWRDQNYKENFIRLLFLIIAPIIFFIPFLVFLELQYHVVSDSLAWFAVSELTLIYGTFKNYEPLMKLSFILLPLTLLFWRRNPKVLFLVVIMMIPPIIYYFEPLRDFISLKLSFVLVRRMFSNLVWYYAVLGLVSGFIILLFDRLVSLIKADRIKQILSICVSSSIALMIGLEGKLQWFKATHQRVFGPAGSEWMEDNLVWLVIIFTALSLALVLAQKVRPKFNQAFVLEAPKNIILVFTLMAATIFWFASDAKPLMSQKLVQQIQTNRFFSAIPDAATKSAQAEDIGGDEVLAFIKNQLPKRPIFSTSSGYRDLSQLADVYMAAWPGVFDPDKELSNLFRTVTPMNDKLACLSYYKVDYLLLVVEASRVDLLGFNTVPVYLTTIFQQTNQLDDNTTEKVIIYQVDKKIQTDYYFAPGSAPPVCRAPKYRE